MGFKTAAVLCCLVAVSLTGVNGQIKAYFNMSEVQGHIEFVEVDNTGNNTRAIVNIRVNSWFNWEIREFPVMMSEEDPCAEEKLGKRVGLTRITTVIDSRTRPGQTIEMPGYSILQGEQAILGRSILMSNQNMRACATIQGSETLMYASVGGHAAGKVELRKIGARYAVFSNLFNTRALTQSTTTIRIYRGSILPDEAPAQKQDILSTERCNLVSGAGLVAEVLNVPIAGAAGDARHFEHVFANVAQVDYSNIWVKLEVDNEWSCANFNPYERKEVQATFSSRGITGYIRLSQEDPYKPTQISVDLMNLNRQVDGYHIHEYPLPYQYDAGSDLCGIGSTGGHFNPFGATALGFNMLINNVATEDLFEVGDLSGKHGRLLNANDWNQTYTDMFVPLFGPNSVVGRSIVLHRPDSHRFICATISYPGPVTVAQAEFNGVTYGTITFVQEEDKPWADTTVLVEVVSAEFTESMNHNWHIHKMQVMGDSVSPTGRCASTGPHWNPFDNPIKETNTYKPACEKHRLGCEVGDLSAKYNQTLNLKSSRDVPQKLFFTDELPLSGGNTIIRRSITIHEANKGPNRFSCGDIMKKLAPIVTTEPTWWGATKTETVTGSVFMASNGLPSNVAVVAVDLKGLAGKGSGYHIHEYPLNTRNPGENVCDTTGGHFNPFEAKNWNTISDTFDNYEVGDLSSKFGTLDGQAAYRRQFFDTNLPLNGYNSVVGRSVVIHDASSKWKCSNTVWDVDAMNATLIEAKADFSGSIRGYMKFSQMTTDEGETNVNIEVMLYYADNNQQATIDHNWHVHVSPVTFGNCMTTGGHYNPFSIDAGSAIYKSQCSTLTPRKCEMGDLSGKLQRLKIGANGEATRYVFNDNFLTLAGKHPIIGRSVVIHAANELGERVACADIVPYGASTQMVKYYIVTPTGPFKDKMSDNIKSRLSMDDLNHVYVKDGEIRGKCTAISIIFTGPNSYALKTNFTNEYFDYNTRNYRVLDIDACAGATGTASLLSAMTLLISLMVALLPQ